MFSSSSPFKRRTLAFTCCLAMFMNAVYTASLGVLLPAIGQTFGLGPAAQGRLFPANFAGFIFVVLIAGQASDRLNRKSVLMAGVALFALGLMLFSRAASFPLALAASVLIGGGGGAVGVTSTALAAELYAHRRASMLAAIQVAYGLGAALGPGVAYILLYQHVSWRWWYAGLGFVNLALLLALQGQIVPLRKKQPGKKEPKQAAPSLLSLLAQRPIRLFCLMNMLYAGAEVGFAAWMPTYFEKHLPGGSSLAGAVVTVFWTAMTVGRSLTGKFMARMPFMRLSARMALAGAISATLALVWHNPFVVMTFVVLTGLCFAGIYILISAAASERYPSSIGAVFGCIVAIGGIGTALLPWAVGTVAESRAGWTGGLILIPCAVVGVAICAHLLQGQSLDQGRD